MKHLSTLVSLFMFTVLCMSVSICTEVVESKKWSLSSDNIRRARSYLQEMRKFYKLALTKEQEADGEEPEFYAVWLTVQNLNAAAELGASDKAVMREVADMALRLNMYMTDGAVTFNEMIEYVKAACRLDGELLPKFKDRMKRLLSSKRRDAKFKKQLRAIIQSIDGGEFDLAPKWVYPPAEPTNVVVSQAPINDSLTPLVKCDKVCKPVKDTFALEDYTMEMISHSLYPTKISTLHLNLPDEFNKHLTDIAVDRYQKFKKGTRGMSVEEVNNRFFAVQAKSDKDQLEPRAVKFWPELYRDSEPFQKLKKLARQACVEHVMRNGKKQDRESLMQMSLVIWAAVYESGTRHQTHTHEQSVCSGVFYANIPETYRTPLIFSDPRGTHPMWMHKLYDQGPDFEPEAPFQHQYYLHPKQGDIVLFPSYLPHGIPQHYTTEPRVVWAFNLEGPIDTWARMNV